MATLKLRAIKPAPFNNKAMTDTLRKAAKDWADWFKTEHVEPVTDGWRGERPVWEVKVYWANQYQLGISILPKDPESEGAKKFMWIDQGTRAHPIRPKRPGGVLAFPSMYQAGSKPGNLYTNTAVSSGPTVFAKEVQHPGTEPRKWIEGLTEIGQDTFEELMSEAMFDAAEASGHAYP